MANSCRYLLCAAVAGSAGLFVNSVEASLVLDSIGLPVTVDFNSFDGSGFSSAPGPGQLDSNTWRAMGFSDGDGMFGGTHVAGDFARGTSSGGVSSGGVYAFEVASGDYALGVQPGGTDFTPGSMTLRVQNNTGSMLNDLALAYDIYAFNDQGRSSSWNLSWSVDDINYTDLAALDFATPEAADAMPSWQFTARGTVLSGLSLARGGLLYLRWTSDDFSGTGSRDEIAIDNVMLTALPAPGAIALLCVAALAGRPRRR